MDSLVKSGWRLASSWKPESKSAKEILNEALKLDLKDVGEASLADLVTRANEDHVFTVPEDGLVLQISKVRNVSAPKVNEESGGAPRMLKLSLGDGHSMIHCVEMKKIDKISTRTPPGTKVRLLPKATVPYVGGFLQISPGHLEVLGGRVDALAEKWEIGLKLAQFTRAKPTDGAGPPPWIPFGKKILPASDSKGFKSLGGASDGKQKSPDDSNSPTKETAEFDSQRQDAIDEAVKKGGKKVFGGGKAEVREATNSKRNNKTRGQDGDTGKPSEDSTRERGEGRRGGRRGRGNRGDESSDAAGFAQSKPTTGVSLFDFVEKEFPGAHEEKEKPSGQRSSAPASRPTNHDQRNLKHHQNDRYGEADNHREQRQKHHQQESRDPRRQQRGRGGQRGGHHGSRDVQHHHQGNPSSGQESGYQSQRHSNRRDNNRQQQDNRRPRGHEERPPRLDTGRGGHHQHQQRNYDRQNPNSSDRDFGEWSNSTYHDAKAQRYQKQQPANPNVGSHSHHHDMNHAFHNMNVGQRSRDFPRSHHSQSRHQQQMNGYRSERTGHKADHQPHSQQMPRMQQFPWAQGMMCLAKYWEDEQFYPAQISALSSNTAVVYFKDYGNHEEVMLADLRPFPNSDKISMPSRDGNFIPVTPGLPPAFPQS